MTTLYYISVFLHIVAACVWIGGMTFLALVLIPVVKRPAFDRVAGRLIRLTGERFRTIGWGIIATLIATGSFNLLYRASWEGIWSAAFWASPFGAILGHKLIVVGAIVVVSAVHDFAVGPKAAELRESEGDDAALTRKLRNRAGWMGRINLLLSLVVVFLAVTMVRA